RIRLRWAKTRKIEPQHRDALVGELECDAPRRQHVLAAGEAIREQRGSDRLALRQIERRRELVASRSRKLKAFDRHVGSPFYSLILRSALLRASRRMAAIRVAHGSRRR